MYNKYTRRSNSLSSADENWLEKVSHEIHDNRVIMNIHDSKVFKILPGIELVIGSYLYTVVTKQMGAAWGLVGTSSYTTHSITLRPSISVSSWRYKRVASKNSSLVENSPAEGWKARITEKEIHVPHLILKRLCVKKKLLFYVNGWQYHVLYAWTSRS